MMKILQNYDGALLRTLSRKADSGVFQMERPDGSLFILRMYRYEVPAYEALCGHTGQSLPKIFSAGWREGCFVVEEEYVDGVSLQEMLEGGARFDEGRALDLSRKISAAAASLHSRGFVHRDIKPEHVLLTADGRVVLIDLDAAMAIRPEKKNDTRLLGTAMYAAPEQFGLSRSDERTDVYAMGILMNELLTGKHPAVKRYQEGPLAEIIERCIRMNPAERYQSAAELEQALKNLQNPAEPQAAKKRRKPALLAGVILCAVIAVFTLLPQPGNRVGPVVSGDAAMVEGTGYYQLYRAGDETDYWNFRSGAQSAPLFTKDGLRVDETWTVYADPEIGFIEDWSERYEGWTLNSVGCTMGASGYIHAEKNGQHYAIQVQVMGEPMSAYTKLPVRADYAEGYLQPEVYPELQSSEIIRLRYRKGKPVTLYLAAMDGFSDLQPACRSGLVDIQPCGDAADGWELPVYVMTFDNPAGGDVIFDVTSNHNTLTFFFEEE